MADRAPGATSGRGSRARCWHRPSSQFTGPRAEAIRLRFADGNFRSDVYITLQRGWAGPRIEAYSGVAGAPTRLRVVPAVTGSLPFARSSDSGNAPPQPPRSFVGMAPWVHLYTPGGAHIIVLVPRTVDSFQGVDDTLGYGGDPRISAEFFAPDYTSVQLDLPTTAAAADARRDEAGRESLMDSRGIRELVSR